MFKVAYMMIEAIRKKNHCIHTHYCFRIAALLKSNHFTAKGLQRTLAAASLAKENVKYNANYVRKSPRALMAKGVFYCIS